MLTNCSSSGAAAGRHYLLHIPSLELVVVDRVETGGASLFAKVRRDADLEQALSRLGSAPRSVRSRLPAEHPPAERLIGSSDGSLLVRREGPEGPVLDVFSPEGVYQGAVRWPGLDRFTLHRASDSILYGITLNEVDIPSVVRLRVQR